MGLRAKYLFCFLIHKNSDGRRNYELPEIKRLSFMRKKGIIYNKETKKYLAFDFHDPKFRVRDNLTWKEVILFLRHEEDQDF